MQSVEMLSTALKIQVYAALLLKYFNQSMEERMRAHGLTLTSLQYGVLRMIQFETLTISEISQRMGLDPSTLVRAMDALERKGLAQRGADPHDRRRNPVQISAKGLELLSAVPPVSPTDQTFQAIQAMGPDAAAALCNLLAELVGQFPEGRMVVGLTASGAPPVDMG